MIASDTYLLANLGGNNRNRFQLIGNNGETLPLTITNANTFQHLNVFMTSPDQKKFAFVADSLAGTFNDLWISSIDGKQQKLVASNFKYTHAYWVNDNIIIAGNVRGGASDWPETRARLKIENSTVEHISQIYLDQGIYAFSPDGSEVIYVKDFRGGWSLYDFNSNTETAVFPWAKDHTITSPGDASVHWTNSGVSLALLNSTSLTLFLNLPAAHIANESIIGQIAVFPDESLAQQVLWWSKDNRYLAILRVYPNSQSPSEGDLFTTRFFLLDTSTWKLYDYCLPTSLTPTLVFASLDDRFLAWKGAQSDETGILVLDILSGKRAWISGPTDLAGWAVIEQSR
jgi:hypothetical protein